VKDLVLVVEKVFFTSLYMLIKECVIVTSSVSPHIYMRRGDTEA